MEGRWGVVVVMMVVVVIRFDYVIVVSTVLSSTVRDISDVMFRF